MSKFWDAGNAIGRGMQNLRFLPATNNYDALAIFPAVIFPSYVPDPQRMYERGEVVRIGDAKYLLQGDGRIDADRPPPVNPLCKLFRDAGRYPWVREEWCSKGFERYWDNPDRPQDSGWYRVSAPNAGDNNTPPPGVPQTWTRLDG